jgi:3-oxoacyl-[acyl-carrier protein] reductase
MTFLAGSINQSIKVERDGRIIGVGSSTRRGFQGVPVYSATKAAMGIFCNVLAIELAPKGITVNSVHPGLLS